MDTLDHAIYHVWIHLFPTSYARGEKPFGLELESNPGPLASQATALTTRPCLLGYQLVSYMRSIYSLVTQEFRQPVANDFKELF